MAVLPLEFTVRGPPVSNQTKNKRRLQQWKQTVKDAAIAAMDGTEEPDGGEIRITIMYFYEGDSPDVDNIIKPIQDALNGLVFNDDAQVTDTRSRKRALNGAYKVRNVSGVLLQAFSEGDAFLHIRVEPTAHEEALE